MFDRIDILHLASGMARHAAAREGEIARNVANADTPGFRARDLRPFAEVLRNGDIPGGDTGLALRRTRPAHLPASGGFDGWDRIDAPDQESPDGNSVSLEDQMVKAAYVRQDHDMALGVYASALGILRSAIGGR